MSYTPNDPNAPVAPFYRRNAEAIITVAVVALIIALAIVFGNWAANSNADYRTKSHAPLNATLRLGVDDCWITDYDSGYDRYTVVLVNRNPTVTTLMNGQLVRNAYAKQNTERP